MSTVTDYCSIFRSNANFTECLSLSQLQLHLFLHFRSPWPSSKHAAASSIQMGGAACMAKYAFHTTRVF